MTPLSGSDARTAGAPPNRLPAKNGAIHHQPHQGRDSVASSSQLFAKAPTTAAPTRTSNGSAEQSSLAALKAEFAAKADLKDKKKKVFVISTV